MGYDEYISNETKGVAKDQDCGVRNLNKAGLEMDIWKMVLWKCSCCL